MDCLAATLLLPASRDTLKVEAAGLFSEIPKTDIFDKVTPIGLATN